MGDRLVGHACFRLHGQSGTVITDPIPKRSGWSFPRSAGDIVTIKPRPSGHHFRSRRQSDPKSSTDRGEYEIKEYLRHRHTDLSTTKKGERSGENNTGYVMEIDGLTSAISATWSRAHTAASGAIGKCQRMLPRPVRARVSTINCRRSGGNCFTPRTPVVIPMHLRTLGI